MEGTQMDEKFKTGFEEMGRILIGFCGFRPWLIIGINWITWTGF